jgi:hypothetical protein
MANDTVADFPLRDDYPGTLLSSNPPKGYALASETFYFVDSGQVRRQVECQILAQLKSDSASACVWACSCYGAFQTAQN